MQYNDGKCVMFAVCYVIAMRYSAHKFHHARELIPFLFLFLFPVLCVCLVREVPKKALVQFVQSVSRTIHGN